MYTNLNDALKLSRFESGLLVDWRARLLGARSSVVGPSADEVDRRACAVFTCLSLCKIY